MLEAPDLGNEDGVMPKEQSPGKPTTRRYSPEEEAAPVRMVRALRAELGTDHGTVHRVASQLGYGIESVRSWVRQADIDEGLTPGVSATEAAKIKELEQEVRELRRPNEPPKRAASFFRGGARPPTQEVVAFIDANRDELGVEPICTVLRSAAQACRWPRAPITRPRRGPRRHGPSGMR